MTKDQVIAYFISADFAKLVLTFWTVPVGMIVLLVYGRFHFNSPPYLLNWADNSDGSIVEGQPRLITPTPPKFTTRRSIYNNYAYRYIILLELAFILLVFGGSLLVDIERVLQLQRKFFLSRRPFRQAGCRDDFIYP